MFVGGRGGGEFCGSGMHLYCVSILRMRSSTHVNTMHRLLQLQYSWYEIIHTREISRINALYLCNNSAHKGVGL